MDYKEYTHRAYEAAKKNGFFDEKPTLEHLLMMVITEVSEMVEADRKRRRAQRPMFERECVSPQPEERVTAHWKFCFELFVKDTVEDEMADICLRIFSLAGAEGWELDDSGFGIISQLMEGIQNDIPFTHLAFGLCRQLTRENPDATTAEVALACVRLWAKEHGIDLEWHINQKMKYNALRGKLHGKSY